MMSLGRKLTALGVPPDQKSKQSWGTNLSLY